MLEFSSTITLVKTNVMHVNINYNCILCKSCVSVNH
jgi:hypothetical protein